MVGVEEGGRDGLNSHVNACAVVDETQTRRPVVCVHRVVGYGGEQEPNAEHDDGEVVGLLRFGHATLGQGGQIGRRRHGRCRRDERAAAAATTTAVDERGRSGRGSSGAAVLGNQSYDCGRCCRTSRHGTTCSVGVGIAAVDMSRVRVVRDGTVVVVGHVGVVADEAPESEIEHENDQCRYDVEQERYEDVAVENVDDQRCRVATATVSATAAMTATMTTRRRRAAATACHVGHAVHEYDLQVAVVFFGWRWALKSDQNNKKELVFYMFDDSNYSVFNFKNWGFNSV